MAARLALETGGLRVDKPWQRREEGEKRARTMCTHIQPPTAMGRVERGPPLACAACYVCCGDREIEPTLHEHFGLYREYGGLNRRGWVSAASRAGHPSTIAHSDRVHACAGSALETQVVCAFSWAVWEPGG